MRQKKLIKGPVYWLFSCELERRSKQTPIRKGSFKKDIGQTCLNGLGWDAPGKIFSHTSQKQFGTSGSSSVTENSNSNQSRGNVCSNLDQDFYPGLKSPVLSLIHFINPVLSILGNGFNPGNFSQRLSHGKIIYRNLIVRTNSTALKGTDDKALANGQG